MGHLKRECFWRAFRDSYFQSFQPMPLLQLFQQRCSQLGTTGQQARFVCFKSTSVYFNLVIGLRNVVSIIFRVFRDSYFQSFRPMPPLQLFQQRRRELGTVDQQARVVRPPLQVLLPLAKVQHEAPNLCALRLDKGPQALYPLDGVPPPLAEANCILPVPSAAEKGVFLVRLRPAVSMSKNDPTFYRLAGHRASECCAGGVLGQAFGKGLTDRLSLLVNKSNLDISEATIAVPNVMQSSLMGQSAPCSLCFVQ
jgi:hypothetical protein